jgi:SNF2 family DNA or RNA helicase
VPPDDRQRRFGTEALVDWKLLVDDEEVPDALLERAAEAGARLLHTGNRWVRIDPDDLRRKRTRRQQLADERSSVTPLELVALANDDESTEERATIEVAANGDVAGDPLSGTPADWANALLAGLPDDRLHEAVESADFTGELRHYQRRGLAWMQFLARLGLGGCLADDMGLGKTATTLAHLVELPGPHLVVCPLSVVRNWRSEAERFTPRLDVRIHHGPDRHRDREDELFTTDPERELVITTYGLLPRDLEHLVELDWSTVVLDEAQMVKNPHTKAARAVRELRAGQKLALTGTPVENRLSELWAILDAVNPGLLGGPESFRRRFASPIERTGDELAATRLRRLTRPFVLRRTKADKRLLPDLPDKVEQIAYARLTREQAVLYQQVVDQLLTDAQETSGIKRRGRVLAALTRLKQICNHPAHALRDGSRLHGRSGKLTRFDELVTDLLDGQEQALAFTQFREMGELLVQHVAERFHLDAAFLHGGVSRVGRDRMVDAFQDGVGAPLLIVSLKAGGTGLNLTAATQVIHYDRWWNPAVEDQATDRAWRIGQHRLVNVHKLVCEGTVEERIGAVIDEKRQLADAVVGTGETWLSELSTDELRDLVVLERDQ